MSRQQPAQAHSQHAPPYYPVGILNGFLTRAPNRANPSTDLDHAPRDFRRYVNASGYADVQQWNGLRNKIGAGKRIPYISYLYAANARIPGQMRDNYGGFHKHGIGPLQYANIFRAGPGSQPQDQGGVRQFAGDFLNNPGTMLWPKKPSTKERNTRQAGKRKVS